MEPPKTPTRDDLIQAAKELAESAIRIHDKADTDSLRKDALRIAGENATFAIRLMREGERRKWVEGLNEPLRSELIERLTKAGLLSR